MFVICYSDYLLSYVKCICNLDRYQAYEMIERFNETFGGNNLCASGSSIFAFCNVGRIKRKNAYEHALNVRVHIILHMRKVSSGHFLSIETVISIQ